MSGSQFFQNLVKGDTAAGVEAEMLPEGGLRMNYAILKRMKASLGIISSGVEVTEIEALTSPVSNGLPLSLAITGKGIISKKTTLSENEDESSLLHKVLPNANPEDFYLQKTGLENNAAIISVLRKSIADELISQFRKAGYFVVNVSFGPSSLAAILPWINFSGGNSVNINGHTLHLDNGELSNYSFEKKNEINEVDIGGERMDERCAIAFASASGYFVSKGETVFIPEITGLQQEFKHKRVFHLAGWTALVIFFSSLLLNFLLFSHYNSRAQELNAKVFKSRDELSGIASLQGELQQKQKFLDRMGLLESSRTSYYADRIASDLPKQIQLSEMFICPVEKNTNAGKKELNFIPDAIQIEGKCRKSAELNDWVKLLKEKDWIKSVTVLNYTQENHGEPGEFRLMVNTK